MTPDSCRHLLGQAATAPTLDFSADELGRSEAERGRLLHEYAGHLEEMREIERRELAKALHNEFGSALTALSMRLGIMERLLPAQPNVAEQWDKVHALLAALAKTARRTQKQLRPASLDVLGIKTAIVEHLHEFEEVSEITCTTSVPEQEAALDEERSLALLRMLQEVLDNVSRHSQARSIDVRLDFADGHTILTVSDDGCGFDLHACDWNATHGLRSIRERTLFLGGRLQIQSAPGSGTVIRIVLPNTAAQPAQPLPQR